MVFVTSQGFIFKNIFRFFPTFVIFFRIGVGYSKFQSLVIYYLIHLNLVSLEGTSLQLDIGVWHGALLIWQRDIKVEMLLTFENKYKLWKYQIKLFSFIYNYFWKFNIYFIVVYTHWPNIRMLCCCISLLGCSIENNFHFNDFSHFFSILQYL